MKMAVVASLLLVSVQTTSAQYSDNYNRPVENFYYQYRDTAAAENDLANAKALRDKARKEREETGKSDVGARLRLQEECTRAIERGVEDGVRRSMRSILLCAVRTAAARGSEGHLPAQVTGRSPAPIQSCPAH